MFTLQEKEDLHQTLLSVADLLVDFFPTDRRSSILAKDLREALSTESKASTPERLNHLVASFEDTHCRQLLTDCQSPQHQTKRKQSKHCYALARFYTPVLPYPMNRDEFIKTHSHCLVNFSYLACCNISRYLLH